MFRIGICARVLTNSPKEFDTRKILGPAKDAMKEVVNGKMRLLVVPEKRS